LFYKRKLIEEKEKIKNEFYAKVANSFGRMKGIEHALTGKKKEITQGQS